MTSFNNQQPKKESKNDDVLFYIDIAESSDESFGVPGACRNDVLPEDDTNANDDDDDNNDNSIIFRDDSPQNQQTPEHDTNANDDGDDDNNLIFRTNSPQNQLIVDGYIEKEEHFDYETLQFIIKYFDYFKDQICTKSLSETATSKVKSPQEILRMCQSYIKGTTKGEKQVKYSWSASCQKARIGRLYVQGGYGLQSLKRCIRHTIASKYYLDIDMVGAHMNILLQYAKKLNLQHECLEDYVSHREDYLEALSKCWDIDRDESKKIVLSIMNGASLDGHLANHGNTTDNGSKLDWLLRLNKELKHLRKKIAKANPMVEAIVRQKGKLFNVAASTLNLVLCDIENKCLQLFTKYFEQNGFKVDVWVFDGLMIRTGKDEPKVTQELLKHASQFVFEQSGYDMEIIIKPMDKGIVFGHTTKTTLSTKVIGDRNFFTFVRNQQRNNLDIYNLMDPQLPTISDVYVTYLSGTPIETNNLHKLNKLIPQVLAVIGNAGETKIALKCIDAQGQRGISILPLNKFRQNGYQKLKMEVVSINEKGEEIVKVVEKDFWTYLKERHGCGIFFDAIAFMPYPSLGSLQRTCTINPFLFNTFTGFDVELTNRKVEAGQLDRPSKHLYDHSVQLFRKHLRVLCGGTQYPNDAELSYEYVENCIAHQFQYPHKKNALGVLLLFQGKQGCGKGLFVETLLGRMIGDKYFTKVDKIEQAVGKFNSAIANKLLVFLDETQSFGGAIKMNDILKGLITSTVLQLEKKGVDCTTIVDHARYIMATNNCFVVKVEPGDRRYCCNRASDELCGDAKYIDSWLQLCDNELARWCIWHYLVQKDIDTFNFKAIPKTSYRMELMEQTNQKHMYFFDWLVSDKFDAAIGYVAGPAFCTPAKCVDQETQMMYSNAVLYNLYCQWYEDEGLYAKHRLAKNKFGKAVENMTNQLHKVNQTLTQSIQYKKMKWKSKSGPAKYRSITSFFIHKPAFKNNDRDGGLVTSLLRKC